MAIRPGSPAPMHAGVDRHRRDARRRAANSGGAADRSAGRRRFRRRRGWSDSRPATPAKCGCDSVRVAREWLLAGPVENVMKIGVGRRHRRIANLDPGDRPGVGGDRLSGARSRQARPTWPARPPSCAASMQRCEATLLALAGGETVCTQRRAARAGQQPGAARDASGAGRRQGHRLRRRPSGRPLVPRGAVLSGLELPARRAWPRTCASWPGWSSEPGTACRQLMRWHAARLIAVLHLQ